MSRIPKVAVAVVAVVVVAAGAVVVYRETDLLTGSLVVFAALLITALLARRVAVREEKQGMADWAEESRASAAAAEDLFGEWNVSSPRNGRATIAGRNGTSDTANAPPPPPPPPPPPSGTGGPAATPGGSGATTEPAPTSVPPRTARPNGRSSRNTESLIAKLYATDPASDGLGSPDGGEDDETGDPPTSTPDGAHPDLVARGNGNGHLGDRAPAFAGAGLTAMGADHQSPIDWTGGQVRVVDDHVRSSDDIMRVSEVTALPAAPDSTGGGELARLLAKVEARLRDYD